MPLKQLVFLLFFILGMATRSQGQNIKLKGRVSNAKLEPLSFVTVQIKGLQIGTRTDDKGEYQFMLEEGEYELVFSLLGYEKQTLKFILDKQTTTQHIILNESTSSINDVRIIAQKKDQAEQIIRNVIQQKEKNTQAIKSYAVDLYIKATEEREELLSAKRQRKLLADTTRKNMDTIPNMSINEVLLTLHYQYPDKMKETRTAVSRRGRQAGLFFLSTTDGDFSLYNNLIKIPALSEMPMLSPISYSGLIAYKYKTKQIIRKKDHSIYIIQFSPTKLGNALVQGEVEIIDTSWAIVNFHYSFPSFHMAEYSYFEVFQENNLVNDKAWLPSKQEFIYIAKQKRSSNNGRTIALYDNYKLDTTFKARYFNTEISSTSASAYEKDSNFWNTVRKVPLSDAEIKYIKKSDSIYNATHSKTYLDSVDKAENKIKILKILVLGINHQNHVRKENWYIFPLLNAYRPLMPGGARIGTGGSYNRQFENKKAISLSADITYGIRNRDFMGELRLFHLYNPFSRGSFSIAAGKSFDLIFNGDSYVNLFRRNNFYIKNRIEANHSIELLNGLVLQTGFEFAERKSINTLNLSRTFDTLFKGSEFFTDPIDFEPYNALYTTLTVEYTPFQTYIREPKEKIILGSKYPTLYVTWRKGIPSIFQSKINFDYLEFGMYQKLKLGLAGISQFRLYSGEFVTRKDLPYVDYKFISRGNPYLFNNPLRSFQALDSTFPIFRRYYEGHYLHAFNGSILNKIPLLKKLKLLEVAGGGVLLVPERKLNYIEGFVGIERIVPIFKEQFKIGLYFVGSMANKYNNPFQLKFGLDQYNRRKNSWY